MSQGKRGIIGLVLSVLFMGILGCGGGGSSTGGGTLPQTSVAPTVTFDGWTPTDASLVQYKTYTFNASGTDPNIGGAITEFQWDLGDGTKKVTPVVLANGKATGSLTYAYTASGSPTLSVIAKNGAGLLSTAVNRSFTVTAAPSPLTVAFTTPVGPITITPALGSSSPLTFQFHVTNTGAGTVSASGILLDAGDPTATQAAPVDLGGGDWRVVVTYPAAATVGSRDVTPKVKVTDSNGLSSDLMVGSVVTVKSVSLVNDPPAITMVAAPKIPAGSNSTWQNVQITFTATAIDPNGDTLTYSWTFGDAGKGDVSPTQSASALSQTHTFATAGVYPVTFTADDGRTGGVKAITLNLNILANSAPALSIVQTPVGSPYANVPLTFSAVVTDADGDTPSIAWDFGDTTTALGSPIIHSFLASGTTIVKATADDGKGGVTVATLTLDVLANRPPVSSVTTPVATLYQSKPYTFTALATDPDAGNTITQYQWDFGDGSGVQTSAVATINHTYASTYTGTAQVKVRAVDNHGSTGDYSQVVLFPVVATPLPVVTFVSPGATTLNVDLSGTVTQSFTISATNPRAGSPGVTDPIPLANITFLPNDAGSTITNSVSNGGGSYTFTVRYPGAGASGTRTSTPTAYATDTVGIQGLPTSGPLMTIKTLGTNHTPTITITDPVTPTSSAYTSKPISFGFTLKDADNDPVTYTVDWGDGSTTATGTPTGDLVVGVAVALNHAYADAFTASAKNAVITVNATDNRSTNAQALQQTRTFTVTFNALPTAAITSPQDSGSAPTGYTPSPLPADTVVVALNGKLSFAGVSTNPGSQDAVTSSWSIPGGVPSTYSGNTPGDVIFAGTAGVITPNTVTYTVTDAFGRTATKQKTVLVDGVNSQQFLLSFYYRLKSDNNGVATLTPVVTVPNGLTAPVQIFQDGQTNTYHVQNQTQVAGAKATVGIPVRSDLPFYIKIPSFGADSNGYMMRIPNAPSTAVNDPANGKYVDDNLGVVLDPNATVSNFGFSSTTTAPWNPTLNIVTAQGFAAENAVTNLRTINGTVSLLGGISPPAPLSARWLSRLSVPATDTTPTEAIPAAWAWGAVDTVTMTGGFSAYQAFADWPIVLKTLETTNATATPTAPGTSSDLRFNMDYEGYKASDAISKIFAARNMQAFRIPKGVTSPYDLDNAGWGRASALSNLNPTRVDSSVPGFYYAAAFNPVGSSTLAGGLQGLSIPYDPTDTADRVVLAAPGPLRNFSNIVRLFGYSEYLWTKVWNWPLVLNSAQLNSADTESLNAYLYFRFSDPLHATPTASHWPSVLGISSVDTSSFNLNANGGSDFDPSGSPVSNTTSPAPSDKASGHFFWTVFTPFYSSAGASTIARTWLAQGTADPLPGQPPVFPVGSATDATSAFGFVPPQDAVVDKRTRKADGTLDYSVSTLNGYRVNWFNPTKDASNNPVAPDFWVIELNVGGTKSHFMLPGNFPATYPGSTVDPATMPILTDARTALVHPTDASPLSGKAVVAPGYCWFDVPLELRPPTGSATTTLTVYAVKSVLSNHAPAGARALNRPEWIEAIKTASASISLKTNGGADLSNVYKIPFNYYWDIVITNGPITTVAQ